MASLNDPAIAGPVGWSERDMRAMWRTVCATIRRVLADSGVPPADIKGVSFSAHGKGLYAVDQDQGSRCATASFPRTIARCRLSVPGRPSTVQPILMPISKSGPTCPVSSPGLAESQRGRLVPASIAF